MPLQPGVYKLTRDVKNPKPDRRTQDFAQRETWKKGTVIVVQVDEHPTKVGETRPDGKGTVWERGDYESRGIKPYHDTYEIKLAALAEAAERISDDDFRAIFRGDNQHPGRFAAYAILGRLYDAGKVTKAEIMAAWRCDQDDENDGEEA